jgi:hypothetical protein
VYKDLYMRWIIIIAVCLCGCAQSKSNVVDINSWSNRQCSYYSVSALSAELVYRIDFLDGSPGNLERFSYEDLLRAATLFSICASDAEMRAFLSLLDGLVTDQMQAGDFLTLNRASVAYKVFGPRAVGSTALLEDALRQVRCIRLRGRDEWDAEYAGQDIIAALRSMNGRGCVAPVFDPANCEAPAPVQPTEQ